jgi:hypothetical protein
MHTGKPGGSLQKVTVRFRKVLKKQKKHYIDCIANGRIDMKSNRKADCQKKGSSYREQRYNMSFYVTNM